MKPEMIVIAGPSGSGKSRHFGAGSFGVAFFNVDDRCAELNGGSYHSIPVEIRAQAQRECEAFVDDCTRRGTSFAVETTLRSAVAIDQAARARFAGFTIKMIFVATDNVEKNVHRVVLRGLDGGHSAPSERIVEIYLRSLENPLARSPCSTKWRSTTTVLTTCRRAWSASTTSNALRSTSRQSRAGWRWR